MIERRIVLEHLTGRWAGLRQIQGREPELRMAHGDVLPLSVEPFDFTVGSLVSHKAGARMVDIHTRYVHYCEALAGV